MEFHGEKTFCLLLIFFSFSLAKEFLQDPHIEIYAKSQLSSSGSVSYKLLHQGNNSETIINPLYFDEQTNQWIEQPNLRAKTSSTIQMDCTAPYAVEWYYEGDGLTDNVDQKDYPYNFKYASVTATRVVKPESFWNESTYSFKAQISNIFVREKLTGNYSCRSIENNSVLTWMYIYFPENSKSFANSEESRRILLHDKDQMIILPENTESLILPCSVSNPKSKVSLFKISSRGSFEKVFIDPPELVFDPRKGFLFSNLNYTYILGTYLCRAENYKSIQIFVFPPKEFVGKFSPDVPHVPIVPGEIQKFECKARENITLVFSEEDFPTELVEYKFSPHGKFPFSASITLNPSDVRKYLRINCTTRSSKQVLNIWEYSYFSNDIEIRYDVPRHRVLCCANSYRLPKLKALQCHSEMECRLKKNFMFEVIEKDPPMSETPGPIPPGCVSLMWVISEGKLDCSLDFKNKETDLVNFQGFISVDPDEIPEPEDIMRIQHDIPFINDKPRDILLGEIFSFYCEASPKYFATGSFYVKFGLLRENGSMEIIEAPHCRFKSCGPNSGIKFDDVTITKVFCFAPLYNSSSEWRNISLPVRVTDEAPITIRAVLAEKRDGVSFPLMDIANTDIILRETAMFRNRRLRLECSSPFQTIWRYEGMGTPVVKGFSNVTELIGNETTTYKFYSAIEFIKVTDSISGKYSCIVKDKPRLSSYFRIFVPGITAFLNLEPKVISVTNVDLDLNKNIVTVPCPVSDSAHVVTLLAESGEIRNQWMVVTPDQYIDYDPLKGFEIQTLNYDLPWNTTYICKTDSGHTSGKIQMISPSEPQFKIIPNSIYADNIPRLKPAVRCEAKKNITLTFSGPLKRRQIMHETDFESEFPYIVSYFPLLLEDDTDYENRFTLISCTTIEDQTILHTWSYTPGNYYKPPLTYYYDQDRVRYICCTNSHAPAVLNYVPCTEVSECNVRKSCLAQNTCGSESEADSKLAHEDLKDDCVGFSIVERNEGLLRCSVGGVYQKYIYKDFIYSHERNDSENQGKSDIIQLGNDALPSQRFERNKTTETNFKIIQSPNSNIIIGSSVAFDCHAPQCEENGLQWALLAKNGSVVYIDGYDDHKGDEGEEQHGWTFVKFDTEEISAVRCFHRNVTCHEKWSGLTWNVTYAQDIDYDATTTNEPSLVFL